MAYITCESHWQKIQIEKDLEGVAILMRRGYEKVNFQSVSNGHFYFSYDKSDRIVKASAWGCVYLGYWEDMPEPKPHWLYGVPDVEIYARAFVEELSVSDVIVVSDESKQSLKAYIFELNDQSKMTPDKIADIIEFIDVRVKT